MALEGVWGQCSSSFFLGGGAVDGRLTAYDQHVFHSSSELSYIFLGVKVFGKCEKLLFIIVAAGVGGGGAFAVLLMVVVVAGAVMFCCCLLLLLLVTIFRSSSPGRRNKESPLHCGPKN